MSTTAHTLRLYQARLAELLRTANDPEAVRRGLLADPELESLAEYVRSLRPEALAIALQLTAKWRPD